MESRSYRCSGRQRCVSSQAEDSKEEEEVVEVVVVVRHHVYIEG